MIAVILDFIKGHWLGTLAGGLAVGIFTTISIQHFEIARLKQKLSQTEAENLSCEYANHALTESLEKQNALIMAAHNAEIERSKKASAAKETAHTVSLGYANTAHTILTEKPSGDDCKDARELADKYIRNMP